MPKKPRLPRIHVYVVARDFGFAPNPFHGVCTLACCKPGIRSTAQNGDWIVGLGGGKIDRVGRCIFGMQVTNAMSFGAYWADPRYLAKRPVRNGSRRMMVGDNIYYRAEDGSWDQLDSHHSQPDGRPDPSNIEVDTRADRVLLSERFLYFGQNAPVVPSAILAAMGHENRQGHRYKFPSGSAEALIKWLVSQAGGEMNLVLGDPVQFRDSAKRYSAGSNKILSEVVHPPGLEPAARVKRQLRRKFVLGQR